MVVLMLVIIMSCKKESTPAPVVPDPVSCFTLSGSSTVMAGQVFTATNCSSNASSYIWEDGTGSTATTTNAFVSYPNTGTYTLKLTAQGNGKVNISSQTITVVPAMGTVTFWESGTPLHNVTTVTINSTTAQITSAYTVGTPACNQSGCASFYLPSGTYSFTATDGTSNWNGSVTIGIGTCLTQELL